MRASQRQADPALGQRDRAPDQGDRHRSHCLRGRAAPRSQASGPSRSVRGRPSGRRARRGRPASQNCARSKTSFMGRQPRSSTSARVGRQDPRSRGRRRSRTQAEDERHVAERERVRVAAEMQVDDAALGDEEAERERPPGDVRAVKGWEAGDRADEEGDGERPRWPRSATTRDGCRALPLCIGILGARLSLCSFRRAGARMLRRT